MLEVFGSVGAERFTLTWRTMDEQIARVRKHWSTPYIRRQLPGLLGEAARDRLNLFTRPYAARTSLIQLDDLTPDQTRALEPHAFLTIQTSPGRAQAWLGIPAIGTEDADRDFRRRVKKAVRSDPMASGSVRIAGSLNFKPKYEPDFPRVAITHAAPGRMTSQQALETSGLVAPSEPPPAVFHAPQGHFRGRKAWPDYRQTLAGAPLNQGNTGPDRSLADFTWCLTALSWGHAPEEVAARLRQVSAKAADQPERYAVTTTQQAGRALASKQRQR
jgi:RepB DNA-primase from phage plasmid